MNLDDLTLGQIKQLQSLVGCTTSKTVKNGGTRIVILQRGWVVVGQYSQEGDECTISNGYVIRSWGTSNGLGEIALNGPTSSTKLDKITETKFHELAAIASLKCEESKWAKHFE